MWFALRSSVGLGGDNYVEDVVVVKRRLVELGFDWIGDGPLVDETTIAAIRLFQAIKNGHQTLANRENDGVVDRGGDTHLWLCADNAPRWGLMPAGSREEGFINSEREDEADRHDYGTSWLADTLRAAGAHYLEGYLRHHPEAAPLMVNDASLPRGGPTRDHATHQTGMCCDLRLPLRGRSTLGRVSVRDAEYDADAMRAMLLSVRSQPLVVRVLFNDESLVRQGLCAALAGHDNHAHIDIRAPVRRG